MKNWAFALGTALVIALPHAIHAKDLTPPPVPDKLKVPAPNELFLVGHAIGTQNYVCLPSGAGFAWSLFTPEATLFKDLALERQVVTHFFSPNPLYAAHGGLGGKVKSFSPFGAMETAGFVPVRPCALAAPK